MCEIILVDKDDNIIGYDEKIPVHINGYLHRAFSVFIWDRKSERVLIQKRASKKYHSGGKWSNSCCSHPYRDERFEDAVKRCILSEYGISVNVADRIKILDKFMYKSDYGGIYEHEIDNVIILFADENEFPEEQFVPAEIEKLRWFAIDELNNFLSENSSLFSSWFENAYQIFLTEESIGSYERLKKYLKKLHNNYMWFDNAMFEQFTEAVDKHEITSGLLTLSETDFFKSIFNMAKRNIDSFKRNLQRMNQADYYKLSDRLYLVNSPSDIVIKCKYTFQHLVGKYKAYIYPYYNNKYCDDMHEPAYSFIAETENNNLIIPYCFESEDMYIINIFYCSDGDEIPFISEKVYALKSDLFGLNVYKADLHMHTTYSDGIESPEFTVASAREKGMDIIAVTDHNNFYGSVVARKFAEENNISISVLHGEEYSLGFSPMHILALGMDKPIDRKYIYKNADETSEAVSMLSEIDTEGLNCDIKAFICTQVLLDKVNENGGVSILAHPFWKPVNSHGERMDTPENLFIALGKDRRFSGIEVVSGSPDGCYSISNLQMSLVNEMSGNLKGIPVIGITDSHNYSTDIITGKHFTIIFAISRNENDILNALKTGRCVAVEMVNDEPLCYGDYRYVKFAHFLVRHFFKEHDEKAMLEGKQIKNQYLAIDNEVN